MRFRLFVFSCVVWWTLSAPTARAVVVVNNLAEANSGNVGIFGTNLGPQWLATSFTTGAGSWQINTVTVLTDEGAPFFNPDQIVWQIRDSNAGTVGNTVLGSLNMSAHNINAETTYTYPLTAPLVLSGNTTYWLVARDTHVNAQYVWAETASDADNGVLGWSIGLDDRASFDSGASWDDPFPFSGLFSIDATAVPEPGSLALIALVGAGWVARRRRSDKSPGVAAV